MLLFLEFLGLMQSCLDLVELGQARPEAREFKNFLVKNRGKCCPFWNFLG